MTIWAVFFTNPFWVSIPAISHIQYRIRHFLLSANHLLDFPPLSVRIYSIFFFLWCNANATNLSSLSAQDRRREWSSAGKTDEVAASEKPPEDKHDADRVAAEVAWRPAVLPAEVTVTDVTLKSLTVTFRESRMAKGFFRDCGLKI